MQDEGGADRDVGELGDELRDFRRATTAGFNALREDMVDMRQEIRTKFDLTAAGQQHIVELIRQVIDRQGSAAPACYVRAVTEHRVPAC